MKKNLKSNFFLYIRCIDEYLNLKFDFILELKKEKIVFTQIEESCDVNSEIMNLGPKSNM